MLLTYTKKDYIELEIGLRVAEIHKVIKVKNDFVPVMLEKHKEEDTQDEVDSYEEQTSNRKQPYDKTESDEIKSSVTAVNCEDENRTKEAAPTHSGKDENTLTEYDGESCDNKDQDSDCKPEDNLQKLCEIKDGNENTNAASCSDGGEMKQVLEPKKSLCMTGKETVNEDQKGQRSELVLESNDTTINIQRNYEGGSDGFEEGDISACLEIDLKDQNDGNFLKRERQMTRAFSQPTQANFKYKARNFISAESGISSLEEPVREFKLFSLDNVELHEVETKFVNRVAKFAGACLNSRVNGTIFFGVADNKVGEFEHGEIVGMNVKEHRVGNIVEEWITKHLRGRNPKYLASSTAEEKKAFSKCILPVKVVPIENSDRVVVEIDIKPEAEITKYLVFRLNFPHEKYPKYFYRDGDSSQQGEIFSFLP